MTLRLRSRQWALAGGTGLTALGMGLITPVLPRYAQTLGASATLVGLLLAGFGMARLLVSLPAAWLAGRVGQRRLLVGSPAVTAVVAALCAIVGGFPALALFCLAEGALAAVYSTVGMAAAVGGAPAQHRGRSLAAYQSAGLLGAALGPALGGLVGQQFGLQAPFLAYAVLAGLAAWWLHERLGEDTPARPAPRTPEQAGLYASAWRMLIAPGLAGLWSLSFALVFTRIGAQMALLPLLGASQLGLNPQQIGLGLSLSGFAALLMFYPAGRLADRLGRKVAVVPGALAMAGALGLFWLSNSYAGFAGAALLLGTGSGLAGPALAAQLADTVPAAGHMTGAAVYRTVSDVGATLAPPVLAWLIDRGSYSLALSATAALLLATAGVFTRSGPTPQQPVVSEH